MKTYEVKKEELKNVKPICYGYKAIKLDSSTLQGDFNYGKNPVGKVFKVDGDISECSWGLHFSIDPAYVFNFYEPLGYNRYFKVAAYEKAEDSKDGFKTVAQCLEFLEEYDLMQFIDLIKKYDRSSAVRNSRAVSDSNAVRDSSAVSWSNAVSESSAVSNSYGVIDCTGIYMCAFCIGLRGGSYMLFNKQVPQDRAYSDIEKIRSFKWYPKFENWYDIKGNKEWWAFCFPQLENVENDIAWSKMPEEMFEYIKNLPEFDEEVWAKITGQRRR